MTMTHPLRSATVPVLLICIGGLIGCAASENDRLELGVARDAGLAPVHAFAPPDVPSSPEGLPNSRFVARDAPSVISMDRSNWTPTPVLVPASQVAAFPDYTTAFSLTHDTARQRREYPTAEQALELGYDTQGVQILEGILAPFAAGLDVALFPIRAVVAPPWFQVGQPIDAEQRQPPSWADQKEADDPR